MRSVTSMTAVQFGAQSAGNLFAGSTRWWGPLPVIAVQALLLLVGALAIRRVPRNEQPPRAPGRASALREIADGLGQVARAPQLRAPLALVFAVGFLFVGPFTVGVPLLVREVYAGGAAEISLGFMLFPLGTIAGSLWLRSRGLRRKGRSSLVALGVGSATMAAMGLGMPLPGLMALSLLFGLGGAWFINANRTLYQSAAPSELRARVLAVYQLGFLGGAPLGALTAGLAGSVMGPERLFLACGTAMLVVIASVWLGTGLARME
jgi:hypothetical protein